jgi:hypothetical protein
MAMNLRGKGGRFDLILFAWACALRLARRYHRTRGLGR